MQPFSNATLRLHFENNTPFTVATHLVREVEVSHWGNCYIEEHYLIRHVGAKIRVCPLSSSHNLKWSPTRPKPQNLSSRHSAARRDGSSCPRCWHVHRVTIGDLSGSSR